MRRLKRRGTRKSKRKTRRTRRRQYGGSIDRIIYTFWTGETEMSPNRKKCLDHLVANAGCDVKVITPANVTPYILADHPFHEGYNLLSQVHRSDYLRTYFMHFHGGGYSDIKFTTGDWNKAFDDILQNDTIFVNGYHEPSPTGVYGGPHAKSLWKEIPGTGAFIMRPKTEFTKQWYGQMIKKMDEKLEDLKKHPATHPRATPEVQPGYPIGWTELLADIFHPLICNFRDKLLFTVPIPDFSKEHK